MKVNNNFKYSIPHLMEAMDKAKVTGWHSDGWVSDVVDAAVKAGYARRPSVTQCEWTEKGVDVYNAFNYRPLNNSMTAVFIGESDFGNEMFSFYSAEINDWMGKRDNSDSKEEGTFILVDNVLHSATIDLEPSAPLKQELQFKKEETRVIIYDPQTKKAKEAIEEELSKDPIEGNKNYNIVVLDPSNKTTCKMKDNEGVYAIPNGVEVIEGNYSSNDCLIMFVGKMDYTDPSSKTKSLSEDITTTDIEKYSENCLDYTTGYDFFQSRNGFCKVFEKGVSQKETLLEEKEEKHLKLLEKSKRVSVLSPLIHKREAAVTEAISKETRIVNLAHHQDPIIERELAELTPFQEQQIRDNGDGNVYGGDRFVGQTIFGVEDTFEPIDKYIKKIKESDFYKFFVETVGNASEPGVRLATDPAYHDFCSTCPTIESISIAIEEWKTKSIPSTMNNESEAENENLNMKR